MEADAFLFRYRTVSVLQLQAFCRGVATTVEAYLRTGDVLQSPIRSTLESNPLTLPSASSTATTTMQFIRVFATLLAFGK